MSAAFARQMTVSASTKRPPAIVSGKRGAPAVEIVNLKVTPLDPVDPELRNRLDIETPHELLQAFTLGSHDIQEGDVLIISDVEYPIRSVADWPVGSTSAAFKQMVIEDLKR